MRYLESRQTGRYETDWRVEAPQKHNEFGLKRETAYSAQKQHLLLIWEGTDLSPTYFQMSCTAHTACIRGFNFFLRQ